MTRPRGRNATIAGGSADTATASQVYGCQKWYRANIAALARAVGTARPGGRGDWTVRLDRDAAQGI